MSVIDRAITKGTVDPEMVSGVKGDKEATNNMGRYLDRLENLRSHARALGNSGKTAPWIIKKVKVKIKKIKSKKKLTKKDKEQLMFYKNIYDL